MYSVLKITFPQPAVNSYHLVTLCQQQTQNCRLTVMWSRLIPNILITNQTLQEKKKCW